MIVKKFGGTSVGSIDRIEAVADRIAEAVANGEKPILAVSAMSGETNRLVDLAEQVDRYYRGPAYDMLVASGEQVSISLLSIALEKRKISARPASQPFSSHASQNDARVSYFSLYRRCSRRRPADRS